MYGHFVQKDTVRKSKKLLKPKKITSTGFPGSTRWVTLSQKEIKLVKQDFPFVSPCWL